MITAGIDVGAKTVKVVLMNDGRVLAKSLVLGGRQKEVAVGQAYDEALKKADLTRDKVNTVVATGVGRKKVTFANREVSEVGAAARGAIELIPTARTVLDVGAEEGRGAKCDAKGKVVDFVINEKCGAGAGSFTEAMSRALEVKVEDMGELSLRSTKSVPMNAQCAVFAESEVVSLIHRKIPKEDIIRAVHEALADRIASMTRSLGIEKDLVLVGGLSKNIGFVTSLKNALGVDIKVPPDAEFVGAMGAALLGKG